jgi:hypothetical protein
MKKFNDPRFEFDDLMLLSTPHLIKRYNRALEQLCGKKTNLDSFHIDCSGFSPEIAEEFNDDDYMDTHGINKQFIIVSISQKSLRSFRSHFSSSVEILKQFMLDNYDALLTLSALDVVYGELDNDIYRVDKIDDIINADKIDIKIDTSQGLIEKAKELNNLIEKLNKSENEKWLLEESFLPIVRLAEKTGNVQHNQIIPEITHYEKKYYYSKHFGGVYVFHQLPEGKTTLITMDPKFNPIALPDKIKHIPGSDARSVHHFLHSHGFITDLESSELILQKNSLKEERYLLTMDYMAMKHGQSPDDTDFYSMKKFINSNLDELPKMFHKLYGLVTAINREQKHLKEDDTIFYTCKVSEKAPGSEHVALINHLMTHYTPYSYLRMFSFNRELFMERYSVWSSPQKEHVKNYLSQHNEIIKEMKKYVN